MLFSEYKIKVFFMVFSAACKEAIEQKFLAEGISLSYSQNNHLVPANCRLVIGELVDLWMLSQEITEVLRENLDRLLVLVNEKTPLLWEEQGMKMSFCFILL